MPYVSLRQFFLLLFLVCVPDMVLADNCAAMEASAPKWFSSELDKAQASRQRGDNINAYEQLGLAVTGLPRRVDVSLDARCVGTALWQRYYELRRKITQPLGQDAEKAERLIGKKGRKASRMKLMRWKASLDFRRSC